MDGGVKVISPNIKYKNTKHMTAVDWLVIKLYAAGSGSPAAYTQIFEQAKEIEKQQHGQTWDAAIKAHDNRGHVHARSLVDFDEWYEQQFKK